MCLTFMGFFQLQVSELRVGGHEVLEFCAEGFSPTPFASAEAEALQFLESGEIGGFVHLVFPKLFDRKRNSGGTRHPHRLEKTRRQTVCQLDRSQETAFLCRSQLLIRCHEFGHGIGFLALIWFL